jgi:copper chaperone CopZ
MEVSDFSLTEIQINNKFLNYLIMKTLKKILIALTIFSLPIVVMGQEKAKSIETVKFVTSIDCEACVNTIMTNLPLEKGIKDVKCNLKTKESAVKYQKEKSNPEEIKKSIEKLGYTAKVITAENNVEKK